MGPRHYPAIGLATITLLLGFTSVSAAAAIQETIPHLPNFIGKNICLGIEAPYNRPDWKSPLITASQHLNGDSIEYRIEFDHSSSIYVTTDLVDEKSCTNLPVDDPRWDRTRHAKFCLRSLDNQDYVRVGFREEYASETDAADLIRSIYSVSACIFEPPGANFQYGYSLRMNSIPVQMR
jgi:hypothetical protein